MIMLECSKCHKMRILDDGDPDEIHNACLEGWDFAFATDLATLCPVCKDGKELAEFTEEF